MADIVNLIAGSLLLLSPAPAHLRRLNGRPRSYSWHSWAFPDQTRQMFHHHRLALPGLRTQISQYRFQPGLIGTYTNIDGSILSIWQVTDQGCQFRTYITGFGVNQRHQHDPI